MKVVDACAGLLVYGSTSFASLVVSFALLLLVAAAMIVLKIDQVEREADAAIAAKLVTGTQNDPLAAYRAQRDKEKKLHSSLTIYGLNRRLDDPSFWFVITLILTTGCAASARSVYAIADKPARSKWARLTLVLLVLLLTAYLLITGLAGEGFFEPNTSDVVFGIRYFSSWLMVLAIVLGLRAFSAALSLTDHAARFAPSAIAPRSEVARAVAARLIMCSYGALVALVSGIAICQALDLLSGAFGPFEGTRKFVLFLQLLPFFLVGMHVKARFGPYYTIDRTSFSFAYLPVIITVVTAGSVLLTRLQEVTKTGLLAILIALVNVVFIYHVRPRVPPLTGPARLHALGPLVERRVYPVARHILRRVGLWRR